MPDTEPDFHVPNVAWSGHHLLVADDKLLGRLRRPELSPSVANTYNQCPARAVGDKVKPWIEDPFAANEMGGHAHWVMEEVFKLPADQRTREKATEFLKARASMVWATDELARKGKAELAANAENRELWFRTIGEWITAQFALEDPTQVEVEAVEFLLDGVRIGAGVGGDEGVPLKGYVDRTDLVAHDGVKRRAVRDYKFGKADKKKLNPDPRYGDDYGDQLRIYSVGYFEKTGEMPAEATLFFPRGPFKRRVDLSPNAIRKTLLSFRGAWNTMNESVDRQAFEAIPSPLCSWCHLVNSCPVARLSDKANAVESRKNMPSAVQLGIPRIRPEAAPSEVLSAPGVTVPLPAPTTIEPVHGDLFPQTLASHPQPGQRGVPMAREQIEELALRGTAREATADQRDQAPAHGGTAIPEGLPGAPDGEHGSTRDLIESAADQLEHGDGPQGIDAGAGAVHVGGDGATAPQNGKRNHMSNDQQLGVRAEDSPWVEEVNGSLNLNAYAASAVFGLVAKAFEYLKAAGVPATGASVRSLSDIMAGIVLRAQEATTGTRSFHRGAQQRIRGLLFAYMDHTPMPFGGTVADWEAWIARAERFIRSGFDTAESLWSRMPVHNEGHFAFASNAPGQTPVAAPVPQPAAAAQ